MKQFVHDVAVLWSGLVTVIFDGAAVSDGSMLMFAMIVCASWNVVEFSVIFASEN